MKWYNDLYVGESIAHKKNRVKWKIVHNAGQPEAYVLTLPSGGCNLLELIPAWNLMQKHYPKENLFIIGLAGDYDEAEELAVSIVTEVYEATGGFKIREYLKNKMKEEQPCTSFF